MICSFCGSSIEPGDSLCKSCGAAVQPPSESTAPQPKNAPQTSLPGPPTPGPRGWILWLAAGVVALAGIAAAVYFITLSRSIDSTPGKDAAAAAAVSPTVTAAPTATPAPAVDASGLIGTWYETTAEHGSITFNSGGTYIEQVYEDSSQGTYTFDPVIGDVIITPDSLGEPRIFCFANGVLTQKDTAQHDILTYGRNYIEPKPKPEPSATPKPKPKSTPHPAPDYSAIEGMWYSVSDPGLSVEFHDDGTTSFDGLSADCTGFEFDADALTGTMMIDEGGGSFPYEFSIESGSLHLLGDIFSRTLHPYTAIYGSWHSSSDPSQCVVFYTDGYAEIYGLDVECTDFTFDADSLTGTIWLDEGGGPFPYDFSIEGGSLHLLGDIFTR